MTKLSRLARLVHRYLPDLIGVATLIDTVLDIVNKVVNYARQVFKLRLLVLE
jgi:hypothetical protein